MVVGLCHQFLQWKSIHFANNFGAQSIEWSDLVIKCALTRKTYNSVSLKINAQNNKGRLFGLCPYTRGGKHEQQN